MSEMLVKVATAIHKGVGFYGEYGSSPLAKEQCDVAARAAVEAVLEHIRARRLSLTVCNHGGDTIEMDPLPPALINAYLLRVLEGYR
jgi:hypothetical protein